MTTFKKFSGVTMIVYLLIGVTVACKKNNEDGSLNKNSSSDTHAIEYWITSGNKASLFKKAESGLDFGELDSGLPIIDVDTTQQYQSIDGFGYCLTGGSAYLINQKLSTDKREALLKELFLTTENNLGISYLRVSIGASDLDDHVFSYDDLPSGQTDASLTHFSLDPDRQNLIPVLKQVLALNPGIKLMGSPWSAPAWMKTNGATKGGSLNPSYYKAYADYFVKYIKGMAQEGIVIDAVTVQNEPENPNNNPSMVMTAAEQANFVKSNLGPAFAAAGLKTRIIVYDHNCDHPEYPIAILGDPVAKGFVDGSAFHMYGGSIEAMSTVHDAYPDKNVYFTEQWTSPQGTFDGDLRWHVKNLIIGATRNWGRNVLEWNLAADPEFKPHTDGGCTECLGALTIGDDVSRNVSYYIIAHASKWVRPGSVRIGSNLPAGLPNVAFIRPDGKKALIVVNDSDDSKSFNIRFKGQAVKVTLLGGSVGTFVW